MTTTDHLRDLGYRARERFDTPVHNCLRISRVLADLCDRARIPAEVQEQALGEQRITHFVVMVPSAELVDVDGEDGSVYVDPTIDQFTLENWQDGVTEIGLGQSEDLPEVGIYPPGVEERDVWYYRK